MRQVLTTIAILIFTFHATAQLPPIDTISIHWERVPGIPGKANGFERIGERLFAATENGLHFSDNGGLSWEWNTSISHEPILNVWKVNDTLFLHQVDKEIIDLAHSENNHHIYRSVDLGLSFIEANRFTTHNGLGAAGWVEVNSMKSTGRFSHAIIHYHHPLSTAFDEYKLWHSWDNGGNWEQSPSANYLNAFPRTFASLGDSIIGIMNDRFRLYNSNSLSDYTEFLLPAMYSGNGTIWTQSDGVLAGYHKYDHKIVTTTDLVNFQLFQLDTFYGVNFFKQAGKRYFIQCYDGILVSDIGSPTNFQPILLDMPPYQSELMGELVTLEQTAENELFLSLKTGHTLRSTDGGLTWQRADFGLSSPKEGWFTRYSDDWISLDYNYYAPIGNDSWQYNYYVPGQEWAPSFLPITKFPEYWLDGKGRKSVDGGQTWQAADTIFTISNASYTTDEGRLFAYGNSRLLKSMDDAEAWALQSDYFFGGRGFFVWGDTILQIGYDGAGLSFDEGVTTAHYFTFPSPLNSNAYLVGDEIRVLTADRTLYTSKDKGLTWENEITFDLWSQHSSWLQFNEHHLLGKWWVTAANGTYPVFSGDKGRTWVYAPGAPANLFGATSQSYMGIPYTVNIHLWQRDSFLYVFSPIAGIWRTSLLDLENEWDEVVGTVSSSSSAATPIGRTINIFPNPFATHLTLEAEAPIESVQFVDVLGRRVAISSDFEVNYMGKPQIVISTTNWQPGIYYIFAHTSAQASPPIKLVKH